jgi:hypothetical protein
MNLLKNEEVASLRVPVNGLMLTNQRIRLARGEECTSMFLSEVSAVHVKFQSNVLWHIVTVLGVLGAMFSYGNASMEFLMASVVAIILGVAMYRFSRSRKFIITSRGGTGLSFRLQNISAGNALSLLEQIEEMKGTIHLMEKTL